MTPIEHEMTFRVRYPETDPAGVVHHSNYFVYFEMGRIELLRSHGVTHRELELSGLVFVVVNAECKFHKPAYYDDLLTLKTIVQKVTKVKALHEYRVTRGDDLLAVGHITLAVVDRNGQVQPIPDWLRGE